jgi:hypothetical protein
MADSNNYIDTITIKGVRYQIQDSRDIVTQEEFDAFCRSLVGQIIDGEYDEDKNSLKITLRENTSSEDQNN